MKPTAATVLPAPGGVLEPEPPVGAGVDGRLGDRLGVLVLGFLPVLGLLVGREQLLLVELGDWGTVAVRGGGGSVAVGLRAVAAVGFAGLVGPLDLGDDRRERA